MGHDVADFLQITKLKFIQFKNIDVADISSKIDTPCLCEFLGLSFIYSLVSLVFLFFF